MMIHIEIEVQFGSPSVVKTPAAKFVRDLTALGFLVTHGEVSEVKDLVHGSAGKIGTSDSTIVENCAAMQEGNGPATSAQTLSDGLESEKPDSSGIVLRG